MKFLFPTVIHETEVPNFDQDTCVKIAKQLKKKDPKGVVKSNVTGWQSEFIYSNSNDYFTNLITETLSNYFIRNKILKSFDMSLHGHWININQPGALNNMHNHPDCHLAGVIWIKTNDKSGTLQFKNPTAFSENKVLQLLTDKFAKDNSLYPAYWMTTPPGCCVLFPSSLDHWVTPNESKEDRISVSFNIKLN